jgi:hypothetical protein
MDAFAIPQQSASLQWTPECSGSSAELLCLLFPPHQNPPHCLEITPPSSEKLVSVMRLSDLSTEDDDSGHCKMNRYDKKIDSLMNAVGCLKSEVREAAGIASKEDMWENPGMFLVDKSLRQILCGHAVPLSKTGISEVSTWGGSWGSLGTLEGPCLLSTCLLLYVDGMI